MSTNTAALPLVTVVMPAFNAEAYITESIGSVLAQTYPNWELIVVNDGSTDATGSILHGYTDPRIICFHKANGGIGSARNRALEVARGIYICFLDADDLMPPRSLEARVALLEQDPGLGIADGRVLFYDARMENVIRIFTPRPTKDPFHSLVIFNGRCYMGISWMFRRDQCKELRFEESITHAEDLWFCLNYAKGKRYGHTDEVVLHYRRTGLTSMNTNLDGMARSMRWISRELRRRRLASCGELLTHELKRRRMMAGSFWGKRERLKALLSLFY